MLAGWKKYRTITIDHTNVTADLADYPLYLNLSAAGGIGDVDLTSIFTELGASQLKIAVADASDAECYVEEVNWDSGTPFAELWANIPAVSSVSDTVITIYYDSTHADNSTYVGVVGSTAGKAVWDSNFKAVYHMNDATTSTIADSTTNTNTGNKVGANTPVETTGLIGKAQHWEAEYRITTTNNDALTAWTVEGIINPDVPIPTGAPFYAYETIIQGNGNTELLCVHTDALTLYTTPLTSYNFSGTPGNHVIAFRYETDQMDASVDGTIGSDSTQASIFDGAETRYIGAKKAAGAGIHYYLGTISEFRISNNHRPDAYIKANNYCFTDALVTFGAEVIISISSGLPYTLNRWRGNLYGTSVVRM